MCSNKIVFCWTPLQNQRWMGPLSWSSASSSSDVGCWTLRSLSLSFWLARSLARSRTFSFVSCKTQEILPSFLVFWIFWISRVLPFIFHSSRPLPPVKKGREEEEENDIKRDDEEQAIHHSLLIFLLPLIFGFLPYRRILFALKIRERVLSPGRRSSR